MIPQLPALQVFLLEVLLDLGGILIVLGMFPEWGLMVGFTIQMHEL